MSWIIGKIKIVSHHIGFLDLRVSGCCLRSDAQLFFVFVAKIIWLPEVFISLAEHASNYKE